MDVSPGPTFTIDGGGGNENQKDRSVLRVMVPPQLFTADGSSEISSSIGTPEDSEEDEELGEDEAQSRLNPQIGLDSLDSLEESLPTKKGLSDHFDGKSKSFTDLNQVSSVKELQKQENPFNKRRRVLMASRWSRRSSFYTWSDPKSMPFLPLHGEEEEECSRKLESPSSLSSSSSSSFTEEKKQEDQILLRRRQKTPRLRPGSFKLRSFSLADLKEHGDDDEEEEEEDA